MHVVDGLDGNSTNSTHTTSWNSCRIGYRFPPSLRRYNTSDENKGDTLLTETHMKQPVSLAIIILILSALTLSLPGVSGVGATTR